MHYCSIIIKPKSMSVAEAGELAGEFLVRHGVADWYSTGNYRERLFYELDQDGKENYESERKRTVSIKEFIKDSANIMFEYDEFNKTRDENEFVVNIW